ncbi:MAG: HAD family hydrolase [Solobacterium sp.]|nr:HAD family hydrolase [Solobacterium sp.]
MKYIFLDIDGTLFSPELGRIPDSALDAVAQARANGSKVFLCTGRSLAECNQYLQTEVNGFVFAAGSMVYADHKRIFDHPLAKEDEGYLKQLIHEMGMGYVAEGQAGGYCDEFGYDALSRYFGGVDCTEETRKRRAMMENCFYPEYYEHDEEKIYKICAYVKHGGHFTPLKNRLPEKYTLTVTVRDPDFDDCAEITDASITKATGIAKILEFYGADVSDAVGIGDSENDLPMLEYCGFGIAMGNAMESLKAKADWVTTPILEDGIRNAFLHIGVIEQ